MLKVELKVKLQKALSDIESSEDEEYSQYLEDNGDMEALARMALAYVHRDF
jgi:hypothetical protein